MSLRPRYSLLTLLILTALVAGGVKLWYGPHHVVERLDPDEEREYSYTPNWRGERIIDGPCISRSMWMKRNYVKIKYYRNGTILSWIYRCSVVPQDTNPAESYPAIQHTDDPFTAHERVLFQQAIKREQKRIAAANQKCHDEYEGDDLSRYSRQHKK